jgi:predicted dehydrogenase
MRGETALNRLLQIEGVEIKAICDLVPDFLQNAGLQITGSGRPPADEYGGEEDWKKICERDDIDLIYNCTPWYLHTPISVYAMKHGKHTAVKCRLHSLWMNAGNSSTPPKKPSGIA